MNSVEEAKEIAERIGYPVMVKASAGGGGRGIRKVDTPDELEAAITAAKTEALSFFGDDGVYLEKFIVDPRHVEIQVLADQYGNVVHLGERDCSVPVSYTHLDVYKRQHIRRMDHKTNRN